VNAPHVPQNPFMAPNGLSNVHDDAYQTDTYAWAGPLGRQPKVNSQFPGTFEDCGITIGFDRLGRLITVCIGQSVQEVTLLDPTTLDKLATYDLGPREIPPGANPLTVSAGAYFYVDQHDRAVVSTKRAIRVVALTGGAAHPRFVLARRYDVRFAVPEDDRINSAIPDFEGRLWFVSRTHGVVGAVNRHSGKVIDHVRLDEPIENSFAVGRYGGVYVVSDAAMYRFDLGDDGRIRTTWRAPYANSGVQKPGQFTAGSGTTPTLMGKHYVSITDNAAHMHVVVYRRTAHARPGRRVVCAHAVFEKGASATENSLIGTGRSMIVENNYGYAPPPFATEDGKTTTPGIERVDVARNRSSCRTKWHSDAVAPSVVPKLSLATGLVYTITKPPGKPDAWYATALDFRTGQRRWSRLLGTGVYYNNHYAGIALSPRGNLYSGVLGGTVRLADAK
jgi:hypothetical protein